MTDTELLATISVLNSHVDHGCTILREKLLFCDTEPDKFSKSLHSAAFHMMLVSDLMAAILIDMRDGSRVSDGHIKTY